MKHASRFTTYLLPALLLALPGLSVAQAARLQMPNLDHLDKKAKEVVNVQIDGAMLKTAGMFMGGKADGSDADKQALQSTLQGLQGIYVKSYEFEQENAYSRSEVDALRNQLTVPGWNRMVSVHNSTEDVDVFIRPNSADGGLVVLVAEPKELTIVNIVGDVDLAKLAQLGGRFGVPQMGRAVPDAASPPAAPAHAGK